MQILNYLNNLKKGHINYFIKVVMINNFIKIINLNTYNCIFDLNIRIQ